MARLLPALLMASSCSWFGGLGAVETDTDPPVTRTVALRWADPAEDARPVPTGPHVVVLMVCTWRADQLPPWGGPAATAPTLAALAERGVHMQTTLAAAPWTRPASAALITGLTPDALGITEPEPGPNHRALPASATTLAEHLHAAGWSTVGVAANPNLNAIWGFDQGFDVYLETAAPAAEAGPTVKVAGTRVVEAVLDAVADRPDKDRPVYLQAMILDPHAPVGVDPEAVAPFQEPGVPRRLARYRAGLRQADDALKALLEGLPAAGMDPAETVVVVIGDHGEGLSLPPGHGPAHGHHLYPSTVHVPWVLAGPGIGTGRIDGLAHQLDLVPTVLSLAGVGAPAGLHGEDLSGAVRAGTGAPARQMGFTRTRFQTSDRAAAWTSELQCQTDLAPKRTARRVSAGLDLPFNRGCCAWARDPACRTPEWDPEVLSALADWVTEQDRLHQAADRQDVAPDPDLTRQLRALGYQQGPP
jgi:arylsulfatase A-like enzyme